MVRTVGNQRGVALVLALWLLVLLSILASEFVLSARGDMGAVTNYKEDREAYFLAYAGVQMAVREMLERSDYHFPGQGGVRFALASDDPGGDNFTSRSNIKLGEGSVSYFVEDETGKLNVNSLASNPGTLAALFAQFFEPDEVDVATMSDSLADWVDTDDYHRTNGAEDEYYATLDPPYGAKDGPLDTLDEIKKVRGFTPEIFGTLAPYLTAFDAGQLNVNTASPEVMLSTGMSEAQVIEIMTERASKGYYNATAKSDCFSIIAEGRIGLKSVHRIKAVVRLVGGKVLFLDWTDDYYGPLPVAEE